MFNRYILLTIKIGIFSITEFTTVLYRYIATQEVLSLISDTISRFRSKFLFKYIYNSDDTLFLAKNKNHSDIYFLLKLSS